MARFVLIRKDGAEYTVPETPLRLEADLHDSLTNHPKLLPAEDMGLGRTVVVGRESGLASGSSDLILVDDRGQICVVEVKKEGNPDVRQVVAQLLDYACALRGKTLAEFERDVFLPYAGRHGAAPSSLSEYLVAAFDLTEEEATDADSPSPSIDTIETALSGSLRTGRFVLVVAAPKIPERVRCVLEYENAQGHRFYGLEVSYFKLSDETLATTEIECFVPRLAVQPSPLERTATRRDGHIHNQASILQRLRDQEDGIRKAEVAAALFDWADQRDVELFFGAGHKEATCYFGREDDRGYLRPLALVAYERTAALYIPFIEMARSRHPSFASETMRKELQHRLNEIPGVSIRDDQLRRYPRVELLKLIDPHVRDKFLGVIQWALDQMNT